MADIAPSTDHFTAKSKKSNDSNHSGDEKAKKKLATLSELFSFSTTEKRTRPFLILGLTSASVTGCVYPAMAFFFAQVFEEFSADVSDGDSFMDGIRRMAYTFMVLGVIAYIFMSIQNTLLDSAATDMANTFQKTYFSLLLHQDPTYFDLTDVAGAAGMISQNGAKFKKGVGRKLGEGIQFGVTMLGGFIYAFYASWMVSLVILTILPVMALSAMFLMNMIANQSSASSKGYQRAGEIAYAAVSGIRTILSLNAVGVTIDKYKGATKEACDSATKREWKLGLANGAVMGSMLLGYVVITLFGMWVLYDEVTKNGCDPSNAVPTNEPCSTTGMDVFGSLMGISFAAMGLPQISAMLEALTAAREAAYPLFVLKRRCDGDYNDDFDIEALLDDNTIGGTKVSDLNISESGKDEGNEDDKKLDQMETTHHKKRIPPSKMPPYLIDASSSSGIKPGTCNGTIEFCNVTFSYPSRRQVKVLDGLSLSIASGKTVAIVGHSGCGKSSIMQLIERFYDVDSDGDGEDVEKGNRNGGIKLDGFDLRDLNVKWLRSQIGLVSQEPKLFAKTIRENIAMGVWGSTSGVEPPTQEEIEEAAKLANAHDFITQFPSGYDTFVGDSGAQLSGGQKQRIAIARVLLRRPKILLLDEATSALDSESERTVQNALDNLLSKDTSSGQSKMTTIVVAHRLSTIRNADLIAVADKGKIVEKGTHEELMVKEDGAYRALVEAQTGRPSNLHNATSNKKNEEKEDDRKDTKDDDRRTSVFVPSTNKSLTEQGNELVLKDVRFHYPTRKTKEIFNGLNLAVKRGETLALVGPSGQGKSTIIQLIERYYDPTHGTIEFEGRDLKSLNIGYYREQIGLVSQEPTLFNDTIAANIKYGKPDASDEEMYEAARMANCHSFITSFPDGYNTNLGETALAVSGGQKQRIAIAKAIIKRPRILLLDEATSALDTGSEKIVQEALDKITSSSSVTSIVIAHRLSTVRNADRIAYISDGKVRETGTHDELMANPDSKYRKLHEMQNMGIEYKDEADDDGNTASDIKHHHHHRHHKHHHKQHNHKKHHHKDDSTKLPEDKEVEESVDNLENTKEKQKEKKNASKARVLAREDWKLFGIGSVGAVLAGLMFPGWGIVFAYMIEFLYYPVFPCDEDAGIMPPPPYTTCIQYWDFVADDMQGMSITLTFGWLGIIGATCIGNILIFYGFGTASEKMNKRVRDAAFTSLLRQEIAFFDCRTVGSLTSQLQDDAAMIHSFSGEPLRQLIMSLASVLVGVVVSFIFMWPFALVSLGTIPFMGFGAEMEMKMYMGEDHGDHSKEEEDGPGAIAIESLLNIRTVASLSLESNRLDEYEKALTKGNEDIVKSSFKKGSLVAIGQFIQMWGCALMFWWGGWLLSKYPSTFTYRDFLISMFSLLFSLSGLGMAAQGATNRDKAKEAADRIFDLMERESAIDPLSKEGYKEE